MDEEAQDPKIALAQQIISRLKEQIESLECLLLAQGDLADVEAMLDRQSSEDGELVSSALQGRVIDGVFDGEYMVGEDGRKYLVPPNYASKSKLVEGDMLRLVINDSGRFIFKQKGPIERQRLLGALMLDEEMSDLRVVANGTKYRVLPASVSFFKGEAGDEAVILVPADTPSRWVAVENVIKRDLSGE